VCGHQWPNPARHGNVAGERDGLNAEKVAVVETLLVMEALCRRGEGVNLRTGSTLLQAVRQFRFVVLWVGLTFPGPIGR